jgi:hypothetical protein
MSYKYPTIFYIYIRDMDNKEYINCYKEKCKDELEKIHNDKKLKVLKKRLEKRKDWKDIDKIIFDIYSNKNQQDFSLCAYKNCKIRKKVHELKIKSWDNKIKIFEINLPKDIQIKYDNLIQLFSKPSLTDEEYIKYISLYRFFQKFIDLKVIEEIFSIFNPIGDYQKCFKKNCKNFTIDDELKKKKNSINLINDEKERNRVIREVNSNEKQVKLDKCGVKNCNNASLKIIQQSLKYYNNIIKAFDIKIPKEIQLSKITELKEEDIPEIMIKFNQIYHYIKKYLYKID